MVDNGFESRVKIQQIIGSHLPEFILDESPKFVDFLKQYYISQEYQSGPIDIVENLDQYLKLDNLIPEVVVGSTILTNSVSNNSNNANYSTISVESTKGFPKSYGLIKIDDEIITYTGITTNTFTGCIRGFSGITDYHEELNQENLVFSTSSVSTHLNASVVTNLSVLFLQEFYKKIKYSLTPELENLNLVENLNVGNFIKEANTLYKTKGTEESFRILFNILYNETPKIINLEDFLIKPSSSNYSRREVLIAEAISGNPSNLRGQTIYKKTDTITSASVSEVETLRRGNKTYHKLQLFVGYDDSFPTITGSFDITGSTKNIDTISVGSSVITVDSTIGFSPSGKLYAGENAISYTEKSINQFFGCSGIDSEIPIASTLYSDKTYYGYENGDLTKLVEVRLTGVLSDIDISEQKYPFNTGEKIFVGDIGEIIENPTSKSKKQVFANSWIYNTSSRYQIDSFQNSDIFTLKDDIDKSGLKIGDRIDLLSRSTNNIEESNLLITNITNKTITVDNSFSVNPSFDYDIRRKIENVPVETSMVPFEYDNVFANIQNVYNENDEYMYVASNSLPSYDITVPIFSYDAISVSDQDVTTGLYSTLNFSEEVSFLTGSQIYYNPSGSAIQGLSPGIYFTQVLNDKTKVKLYSSKFGIENSSNVYFGNLTSGTHEFILFSQKENIVSPQKILRKFPISPNLSEKNSNVTKIGRIGLLSNGVEILNYKSDNKIYYGPLKSVNALNGGEDYDVINPPLITLNQGSALVQPIVRGSFKKVYVDPQEFDVDIVVSINLTGGNGSGASFEPVVERKQRDISFNAKQLLSGGGVDVTNETITFETSHGLVDGQIISYDPLNNSPLGIGSFGQSNANTQLSLKKDVDYVAKYVNDATIQLYPSISDYKSGINTVGFTTIGTSGIHRFYTLKNSLTGIKVINGGSGYENRKLIVTSVGVSTINSIISFENHGFKQGDIVSYLNTGTVISGLSTSNQYYINKIDENNFKLSDAGIGGTITTNYERGKYVKFETTGSEQHIFKYPDIVLDVSYSTSGIGNTQTKGSIVSTPIVTGEIVGTYVYDGGSNYGSTILNYHKKPLVSIKTGRNGQLSPVIIDGKIISVSILFGGSEYYSTPEIEVIGDGIGAILRPVIENNKITRVVIINSGYGYSTLNTRLVVKSNGKKAILDPQVRDLTVDNNPLYNATNGEIIISSKNNLQYLISSYSEKIQNIFDDDISKHSPIIGWAYDGNPIYGSYGYTDPKDKDSEIKKLHSGYVLNSTEVLNRPSTSIFSSGFFVEDYQFTNFGDLDEYNGRFCVTPEFPNGVYAYFATSEINGNSDNVPSFPYFIGNEYRSKFIEENQFLDQSFDFNNSNLVRNTFPYNVTQGNDFIINPNEYSNPQAVVTTIKSGTIDSFKIINPGKDYKVNDNIVVDETGTGGGGLIANISEIFGQTIESIETQATEYENVLVTWKNNSQLSFIFNSPHYLNNLDRVNIAGLSTDISGVNGIQKIGVTSFSSTLLSDISSSGIVTDIYVSQIPKSVSVGSSVKIDSEIFKLINIYDSDNVIRVSRGPGTYHTSSAIVEFLPNEFTIDKSIQYFDSSKNDTVYFNPSQSVGVGTIPGSQVNNTYTIGSKTINISVPTQTIFLPDHPFENNQKVILYAPLAVSVANTSGSTPFNLPSSGTEQTVYIIKKSNSQIGIVTQIGLTTTTNGLYFINSGSNNFQYSLRTDYKQIFASVKNYDAQVSVSTYHNLLSGDKVNLKVIPNLSVGIGTSSTVKIKYDTIFNKLVANPINFSSSGINTSNSQITINNHGFKTGDKLIYNSTNIASGLSTGIYYALTINDDTIKLCETLKDSVNKNPLTIDILNAPAATHTLSLVNPALSPITGNNLVFDLSDNSLDGYNFKIFYDENFRSEFVSTSSTSEFSVNRTGLPGSANASLEITYNDNLTYPFYYTIENDGSIIEPDTEVNNYSKINAINSAYNGTYEIKSITPTTFSVSLFNSPEKNLYQKSDCSTLEYSTSSLSASGEIKQIRIISSGSNYKSMPVVTKVNSLNGTDAYIIPQSKLSGNLKEIEIMDGGFEYPSDKTLRPSALLSKSISIKNSYTVSNISVLDGGKNFTTTPNIIIFDPETGKQVDSGALIANLSGSSIVSVSIEQEPRILSTSNVELRTINNSNGIQIDSISGISSGSVNCTIRTPLSGVFQLGEPFSIGDEIFVEGIQKEGLGGDGFNSQDYGYKFFKVENYLYTTPRQITFSGVSTNPGVAKSDLEYNGIIVNYKNYPKFSVEKLFSDFINGESLEVNFGFGFFAQDLKILESNENYIKVAGRYDLKINETIRGIQSGTTGTISDIEKSSGYFIVNYGDFKNMGWKDNIGKLSDDTQVIADNDYYQSLSYSVKSKKQWSEIISPVNNLLHVSGLKNFSDTEIISSASVGVVTTSTIATENYTSIVYKFVNENRVDTINNFDLVNDIDIVSNSSNFLKFKNKKLAGYIESKTNRVLEIDDISFEFNTQEDISEGFELDYQGTPIFAKTFNPSNSSVVNLSTGNFSIINHFFSTGEELYYNPNGSPVGIASTLNNVGVVTNRLPSTVYAIKIDNNNFKIATRREYATATPAIGVTFTSVGVGTTHQFEMVNRNSKSIININEVVQYPISYALVNHTLAGYSVGSSTTTFVLSGISSIFPDDILKVDNEYVNVLNVGFGTTSSGPVSFAGTFPLVNVKRGFVGSSSTSHSGLSTAYLYRGSYNITNNKIFFTDSLKSTLGVSSFFEENNISPYVANFNGRVFLRKNYLNNQIFDNFSDQFTGVGQTFRVTVGGANTVGLGTTSAGNGIVFINGIFQTPTTENNSLDIGTNYSVIEDANVGVSSIVFTGVKFPNGSQSIVDYDVNINQLPRGGVIVSLGSTPGLGYAPLVGASVTAVIGAGGSITSIGIGTLGNSGSGYRGNVSIAVTEFGHSGTAATITAIVGAGGSLSFSIVGGGTNYTNPTITIPSPSYSNLPIIGVSRVSAGQTTESGIGLLLDIEVGASSTTGIGSTLFEVKNFNISRNGYGFKKGDVIKAVGLVTDKNLSSPVYNFELTILETFTDNFAGWQFGQLDYIDSVKPYQDGFRKRFPLFYNNNLVSFSKNDTDPDSLLIDYNPLLLIFINGILQQPGVAYEFKGGTSFTFSEAPKLQDNISIFFFRGSPDDSIIVESAESIKPGDTVQVFSNNNYLGITTTQNPRTVFEISAADKIETNLYNAQGIDINQEKPINWTKQKVDKIIGGDFVSKSRDSLETQVYPTAKIIRSFSSESNEIFVDNAEFFNYESENNIDFDALIVSGKENTVSSRIGVNVAVNGSLSFTIINGGSGYTPSSSVPLSISNPIGSGITASATAIISSSGQVSSISVSEVGSGYSTSSPPQVLVPPPSIIVDKINTVSSVIGFSGQITGIQTTSGIGTNLAIRFTLQSPLGFSGLATGYPIYIFNTKVGNGVTSIIDSNNNVVGVGTTFLDNIYYINSFNSSSGIITCNVHSSSPVVGIATTGSYLGNFSWGRLSGFNRSSSPISIGVSQYTVDVGLTTFPTIQRRGYGLRSTGALVKTLQ
jgi:hypothetical protein